MADIYGQLVKAQLEHSTSDLSNVSGLVYYKSDTGVVKYYDAVGAAWKTLADTDTATSSAAGLVTSFAPTVQSSFLNYTTDANLTITDSDGYEKIFIATASARSVILPVAANNDGRRIIIKNTGSTTISIDNSASDSATIDGETDISLNGSHNESVELVCDGTNWKIATTYIPTVLTSSGTGASATDGSFVDLCNVSLTKGTWLVSCTAHSASGAGNQVGIAFTTTQDSTTGTTVGQTQFGAFTNGTVRMCAVMPPTPIAVASTTTYYLNAAIFNGGTTTATGYIVAKKIGYKST